MIDSRLLTDLHPLAEAKCKEFVEACLERLNVVVLITSTLRDSECQNKLYARGRTEVGANPTKAKPMGDIVTKAKGGQSFHNFAVAWDFVPLNNGKAMWRDLATFAKCGEVAESLGIEWAGRWKTMKESAHCQYTQGLTLKEFQAGKMIE